MAITVVDYVLTRLKEQGVTHLFGVPALYCAALFDAAPAHGIMPVVTASDLEAGYAADGYARTKGLAAVSVANGVGTLSLINAIGGAYVERSPVVVINGGPTAGHLADLAQRDVLYSHSTGRANAELDAFALVTAKSVRAATKDAVPAAVDGAITAALTSKRPVYIEIAMDLWSQTCANPGPPLTSNVPPAGTETQLAATIVGLIRGAQKPVILIGTEIARYGLADAVADLIAKLGVRWASDMLSKSTLAEKGAGWIGVYDPPYVPQAIRTPGRIGRSVGDARLRVPQQLCAPGHPEVRQHGRRLRRQGAGEEPAQAERRDPGAGRGDAHQGRRAAARECSRRCGARGASRSHGALTYKQVFQRVGNALDETLITIPDTFLGTYSAANLPVKGKDAFLCDAVWASIGHSVAAAVGASFGSARRPLVICGDGGFQMTAQALSTMARYGRNPIVVLIVNGIYGFEQFLLDRSYFNTNSNTPARPYAVIGQWDFVKFANSVGVQFAKVVNTAAALDAELAAAKANPGPSLIVAQVPPRGLPTEME